MGDHTVLMNQPKWELLEWCQSSGVGWRDPCGIRVFDWSRYQSHPLAGAAASCIVRVGRDLYIDHSDYTKPDVAGWFAEEYPQLRVHQCVTEGHGDSVFAILKPGVILTTFHDEYINYAADFPGWSVHRIDSTTVQRLADRGAVHHPFSRAWATPGISGGAEFAAYVDACLGAWTGDSSETVFDVNCVSISPECTVFSDEEPGVFAYCEANGVEPVVLQFRHRVFFDAGWSCVTSDISRKGGLEDYFT